VASSFDDTDFVDSDFQSAKASGFAAPATPSGGSRPPSREELETRVGETQQRLHELKRVQEELERERAALEEARRRRTEFQTGREEMLQHLTRGIGLLEEAEFGARRDAEQIAKTLGELRDALIKVQTLNDQTWTQETYSVELTRALTAIENARMEWNAAQLKWPVLTGTAAETGPPATDAAEGPRSLTALSFGQLCRLGLALTWPLALVGLLLGLAVLAAVWLRR
jgi:hypothetical protein